MSDTTRNHLNKLHLEISINLKCKGEDLATNMGLIMHEVYHLLVAEGIGLPVPSVPGPINTPAVDHCINQQLETDHD